MNSLDAVEKILSKAGKPLHYVEITRRVLSMNIWASKGKSPHATINAKLSVDIKQHDHRSRFVRTAPGIYGLSVWASELFPDEITTEPEQPETEKLSFTNAAEFVLEQVADKKPMHYREIADMILELDLVDTKGKTPEATLYSLIHSEIRNKAKRGESSRFVQYGEGMVGLRKWMGEGLAYQIDQHNRSVKKNLLNQLYQVKPKDFEQLIGQLLGEMGFEETQVTEYSGDGGIDVRATLVVGDVIRTRMAIQVKRWKGHNVQAPIVQQVRGSLGAHEQGMIITTSDFSKGAITEAARADAIPVALVNGKQLVELLIEHQVLVKRVPYELIYLDNESKGRET